MKYTLLCICTYLTIELINSQELKELSLQQVITIATENSLEVFKNKNMYLASYWEYKSFRSSQLPSLKLNLTPIDFRRTMTKRYDFEQDVEIFREQKTMENYAQLSLTQTIPGLGGEVYIDSDLSRLVNFGDSEVTTFSATWFRVGIIQPLFGFNQLKWERKTLPLQFEKAKKEYLLSLEETKIKAVKLYFELLLATVKKEIAQNNYSTSDTLYQLGTKKIEILSIGREELLDLELSKFNSEIELKKAEQDIEKSLFNLNSFLGFEEHVKIKPVYPEAPDEIEIKPMEAVEIAKKNNPAILELEYNKLKADEALDKATKEAKFNTNLTASFGLNQYAEELPQAYKNPLDQQVVIIGLEIPILDWGEKKGKKQVAQKNKEIIYIEAKQTLTDFEQSVVLKTLDLNLQPQLVKSAGKANEIAELSFNLTKKKFMLGKADILKMKEAMKARQSATENYINSIYTWWTCYYELQKLTLFNLKEKKDLNEDFESLINMR